MFAYRKVLRIATHIEDNIAWIQIEDAGHRGWKDAFGREADWLLWCEDPRDVYFSILVNSAEMDKAQKPSSFLKCGCGWKAEVKVFQCFLYAPVEDDPVKVWGGHAGGCYLAGLQLMDHSTQLVDTDQHSVPDSHPYVVPRRLELREVDDTIWK